MWVVWFTDLAPGAHEVQLAAFKEGAGTVQMVQRSMIVRVYGRARHDDGRAHHHDDEHDDEK
jgi:hypothetical protein